MHNQSIEHFKHFLLCYFNISADFSDLKNLISFYKKTETEQTRRELLSEIILLIEREEWSYVHGMVKEYGMRKVNEERIKELMFLLRDVLS